MRFAINDRVWWVSQSAGVSKLKEGRVVQVVYPGEDPIGVRNPGTGRDHISYVVRVPGRGLYWPRVAALRSAADGVPRGAA